MNLDLNLFPLLCFCVSLCITLCSVCLHTSVSVFSWVSVCVLSAPTRMFPCVLCPVCPHCSVSVCPWVSLCVLSPHICFCLSLGITLCSVPTALFLSVPGYHFVSCIHMSVSVCPLFCLSPLLCFSLSLGIFLCSVCPYTSFSVSHWVFWVSQKSVSVCLWKVCSSACWRSFGSSTKSLSV